MKKPAIALLISTCLITCNSFAQQNTQVTNSDSYTLSDELTNISTTENNYFYLKLGLGISSYSKQKDVSSIFSSQEIEFDEGFGLYTTIGAKLGKHAAIELELSRQRSKFSGVGTNGVKFTAANADYKTAMVNVLLRPDIKSLPEHINPYLGAGVGVSRISYSVPASPFSKKSDTVAARQFILGNRFDLRDDFFLDTEYRYFKTKNPKVKAQNGFPFEFDNSASQSFIVSYGKKF
jgi:opacity protein-like surface antigen